MVVPVLMINCQVSEKSKSGPVMAHAKIMANAAKKAKELPVMMVTVLAKRSKNPAGFFTFLDSPYSLLFTCKQFKSSKACVSRFTNCSSPFLNQTRGS